MPWPIVKSHLNDTYLKSKIRSDTWATFSVFRGCTNCCSPWEARSAEPLKSMVVPSSQGLFREFHSDDSETAADRRPFSSGIYSMLPGWDAGEIGVTGLISDSDSPLSFFEIFDKSSKDDDFSGGDLRESCCSGVDAVEGCSLGLDTDPVGVGGCTLMTGTNEGDSISLVPLEVYVKNVSGSRLLFALWLSSSPVAAPL